MKLIKKNFIGLMIIAILQACGSSSTIYKIKDLPANYSAHEVVNDYYNDDAKIGYTILKDESNIYVNISSVETASQLKILQNGVKLYLDKEGGENKSSYIHYPISSEVKNRNNVKDLRQNKTAFLNARISLLKDDILLVDNDSQEYINCQLNNKNITTDIKVIEDELFYQIKFPIDFIATNDGKLPSLGIEIKGLKGNRQSQPSQVVKSGNRGGGSRGGGGRGGRGGGRGNNTTTTASTNNSTPQIQGLGNDIKIWLTVDISE